MQHLSLLLHTFLLSQHLLAIDDNNTLVGVVDKLASKVIDSTTGILIGSHHVVDASGFVEEEAFST